MDSIFQIDEDVLSDPDYTIEYYGQKTVMMKELSRIKIAECLHIKHKPSERILDLRGTIIYDFSSNIIDSVIYIDSTNRLYSNIKKVKIFKDAKRDLIAAMEKVN